MSKYSKVIIFNNEIEADLMDEILKEKQIPHLIQTYHSEIYDGLFQLNKGWGHIEAEKEYHDEIKSIYNDLKTAQIEEKDIE